MWFDSLNYLLVKDVLKKVGFQSGSCVTRVTYAFNFSSIKWESYPPNGVTVKIQ